MALLLAFNQAKSEFDSHRDHKDSKAHVEELAPLKGEVVGSNPTGVTK